MGGGGRREVEGGRVGRKWRGKERGKGRRGAEVWRLLVLTEINWRLLRLLEVTVDY